MRDVRIFGAPVIDAHGKRAAKMSAGSLAQRARIVDVICQSVGCRSTSNSASTRTPPKSATRPRSLRIMSTIIRFSARFFSECCSHAARDLSSSSVRPRCTVPFMGLHVRVPPSRWKKSSGDAEQSAYRPAST